ncbi:MAG: N-formylglutamate amidohydrolase [Methyloprofundus sp.]|nr:N-formylglutamate amidohydrolase [Methyloprofundus sp.]
MILHIPHSSINMPVFYPDLPELHLKRHTDWFTDELFEFEGATRFVFEYSRFYADMERLEHDPLESKGMGIFYTRTPWDALYRDIEDEQYQKVMALYHKWHEALAKEAQQQIKENGYCVLVDCHSFSHHQVEDEEESLPDINIGTNPKSTSQKLTYLIQATFEEAGYSVSINYPYAYSIEPVQSRGFETIMIEINKRCYLTETFTKTQGFQPLKKTLHDVLTVISSCVESRNE